MVRSLGSLRCLLAFASGLFSRCLLVCDARVSCCVDSFLFFFALALQPVSARCKLSQAALIGQGHAVDAACPVCAKTGGDALVGEHVDPPAGAFLSLKSRRCLFRAFVRLRLSSLRQSCRLQLVILCLVDAGCCLAAVATFLRCMLSRAGFSVCLFAVCLSCSACASTLNSRLAATSTRSGEFLLFCRNFFVCSPSLPRVPVVMCVLEAVDSGLLGLYLPAKLFLVLAVFCLSQ